MSDLSSVVESDGGGEPIILESTVFAMPALQVSCGRGLVNWWAGGVCGEGRCRCLHVHEQRQCCSLTGPCTHHSVRLLSESLPAQVRRFSLLSQALTLELLTLPLPLGFSSNEAPPAAASTLRTLCIASAVTAAVPDTIAALTHLDCLELADSSDLSPPPSAAFAALLDALAELPELSILVVDREGLQLCPSAQAQLDSLLAVCERRQLLLEAEQ